VKASDVFVDLGSGVGRTAALVHLFDRGPGDRHRDPAPRCARLARARARLNGLRFSPIEGDATRLAGFIAVGSVFFLYCPFSGARVEGVLDDSSPSRAPGRFGSAGVDLPVPPRDWLTLAAPPSGDLEVYRSTLLDRSS